MDIRLQAEALKRIRDGLAKHAWAFAKDRDAAEAIAAAGNLGPHTPDAVHEIARHAAGVYFSQCRRMREWPLGAAYVARAEMPGVPAAVHEACQFLTALDADRAQDRNRRGWSTTTTFAGHLLAGMAREEIGLRETVYGLELVHKHRRQLPPHIRTILFAGAGGELTL
ncbi:hypothetical protein [Methylobacterium phyllostachyos]|uniref:hypothetical protein n=1 Tax=Methylobacterium phyllostachyos TaxID=582672 RepID=UPI000B866792|nr:hypothetical protein [Methylobacterium phyllostachyos]